LVLDDATNSERGAAAAVEAAKAKVAEAELNLGYTIIRAPITGLSSFATKHDGSYIGPGADSMLTYVAALDPMRINFSLSENQVLRIREEIKAGRLVVPPDNSFDVEVILGDGTVHPKRGELTFSDLAFSRETGTFLVRAEVPNPDDDLRPGQFVRARLIGAVRPKAILVPKRAVLQGAQGSFVWVVGADGKAELRPLELGDIENIYVRSRSNKMVPLSAVVTTRYSVGPDLIQRFNNFLSVRVNGNAAQGFSSGQAIAAMETVAREALFFYLIERSGERFASAKKSSAKVPPAPERTSGGLPATGG
jgi:multidrug efflux pump subunit AcrA (membrane-fusion protein)